MHDTDGPIEIKWNCKCKAGIGLVKWHRGADRSLLSSEFKSISEPSPTDRGTSRCLFVGRTPRLLFLSNASLGRASESGIVPDLNYYRSSRRALRRDVMHAGFG